MHTVKIEHAIGDFETWKRAFAADPVGRERSGVRRYRVSRPLDDPQYILIDLDFDDAVKAESFVEAMRGVWASVAKSPGLLRGTPPSARITSVVETHEY